ncbi:MAG: hypothetical protein H5T41_10800 [Methanomassiliicoccales archaeon]|nr:hypothetical protein [Methanomassiliicoccales archaeon]
MVFTTQGAPTPEGKGVQEDPPGNAYGREPAAYQPTRGLTIFPPDEVPTGTWLIWEFGYLGSTSPEELEPCIDWIEIVEFTIDGKAVPNPERYIVIYKRGTYWSLSFRYKHPPLSPGQHTWSFTSYMTFPPITHEWPPVKWSRCGSGTFTVVQREGE